MKILNFVGARPNFVKVLPILQAIATYNSEAGKSTDKITEVLVHTGQHYDYQMSEIFGLRSYNRKMPEEINRILTDRLSAHLFCPTQRAVENLAQEGMTTGDCPEEIPDFSQVCPQAQKLSVSQCSSGGEHR
jgi:UDP-N-acetylglucosamine 2-epimerase